MTFRRGYLYWVRMEGERKQRPALVVSPDRRNDLAATVVIIPCSTTRRMGSWNIALRRREGGLPQDSVLKCEEITSLRKERLEPGPLGGPLSMERLGEVRAAILRALAYE